MDPWRFPRMNCEFQIVVGEHGFMLGGGNVHAFSHILIMHEHTQGHERESNLKVTIKPKQITSNLVIPKIN